MRSLCPPSLREKFRDKFSHDSWSCCGHASLSNPVGMGVKTGETPLILTALNCSASGFEVQFFTFGRESHNPSDCSRSNLYFYLMQPHAALPAATFSLLRWASTAWEVMVPFHLDISLCKQAADFPRWCQGSGPLPGTRNHVPTCWLSLCMCSRPAFCSLSFLTVPSLTAAIGQLWFCNQGRKKEKKLLIQCSFPRLMFCWSNGVIYRTTDSGTLWDTNAGPSALSFGLSVRKPWFLSSCCSSCLPWHVLLTLKEELAVLQLIPFLPTLMQKMLLMFSL